MEQTAVEWLYAELVNHIDMPLNHREELLNQAKEMENEQKNQMYNETEVLQLLIKLKQTESFDNLYEWFEENKKTFKSE